MQEIKKLMWTLDKTCVNGNQVRSDTPGYKGSWDARLAVGFATFPYFLMPWLGKRSEHSECVCCC